MTDAQKSLPPYDDAQKLRLMDWVHGLFLKGWKNSTPLSVLLAEALESLQKREQHHRIALMGAGAVDKPLWCAWEGDPEDFLEHLYYAGVPGCVPFTGEQTVKRYVEISFGKDALEFLDRQVQEGSAESLTNFTSYLAACSFRSTRLKRFTIPVELELLAAAALRRPPPAQPPPPPAAPLPPMKTRPHSPQGQLF